MNDHRTKINFHSQTCIGCGDHVSHEFILKVIKDKEGFWMGHGPYSSEQEVAEIIKKTEQTLEARRKEA